MLGWPSATFPLLVDTEKSPILITWDQSAMIAGFLMEGNIIGTAFSSVTFLGSKMGILLSSVCQIGGWIMMFYAQDVIGIGVSRVLIGIGNGFGAGQLRIYAEESCEPQLYKLLMQYSPLAVNVGVIFTFIIGGFVSFRVLSVVCVTIPIITCLLFAIIPKHIHKSQNYLEKMETSKASADIKTSAKSPKNSQIGFIEAFRTKKTRNGMFLLFLIIFIPQYTGGAANIVYSQVVHIAALNPYPHLSSIIYSFVFLFSTIVAIKYTSKFPRKPLLIGSCLICSLILCGVCFYFHFIKDLINVSSTFSWSPLLLLSLFNLFHAVGVNAVPILLIVDKFPANARIVASKFYVMYFSLSAVLSTKLFQVLFHYCSMQIAYAVLSGVSFVSGILALFFFKESKHNEVAPSIEGFYNEVDLKDEIAVVDNCNAVQQNGEVKPKNAINQNQVITRCSNLDDNVNEKNEIMTCRL